MLKLLSLSFFKTATSKTWFRNIGTLVLIAGFGLLATGCGKKTSTAVQTSDTGQIRIWRINQPVDPFRDIIRDFNRNYPNIAITYNNYDYPRYELGALKSLAGKNGPDIWSIPNDWLGDYPDQTLALPSNFFYENSDSTGPTPAEAVKQLFPEGIASQLIRNDGEVYGIPTNVDSLKLYYNPAILSDAIDEYRKSLGENINDDAYASVRKLLSGPPSTWNDLLEQEKYITRTQGTNVSRATIALGNSNNIPEAQDILEMLMLQNGSKVISSDHKTALFHITESTPSGGKVRPGELAFTFFSSFSNPAKENYTWNAAMPSAIDAFGQGQVAMVIGYNDFYNQLRIKYPQFRPEVAAVPQIGSPQAPVNFVKFSVETVTKTADNPQAAFEFLRSYANADFIEGLSSEAGLQTPYLSGLNRNSDDFLKYQILNGQAVYKKFHPEFDDVFTQMITDVSQNGIPVNQALDNGAEKVNNLLNLE